MTPTVRSKAKKRRKKSTEVIRCVSDDIGNLVICKNNGRRIILLLKLVKEKRRRRLGVVNKKQKTFSVKRSRSKHLFRELNAYGFNVKILADSKLFDHIYLNDEYNFWKIPKAFILENGRYLDFKGKGGFEKQVFVRLDMIEQFKREPLF